MRWGLIPRWHTVTALATDAEPGRTASGRWRGPKFPTLNARADGLTSKATWRGPWKDRQRCVMLASGFWEWSGKTRHTLDAGHVLALAGLWEGWTPRLDGEALPAVTSCTMVTTDPDEVVAQVHDRAPVPLNWQEARLWLDTGTPADAAQELLGTRRGVWTLSGDTPR